MSSWRAHLGDEATPQALVYSIAGKGKRRALAGATKLRDEIKKEFCLKD